MDRYALNVTPLAGHATLYGGGVSAQALSAQGVPALMIFGRSLPAALAIDAAGAGMLALLGRGAAEMALAAAGRGYLLLCGLGDVAFMALSALADGRVIPVARGVAAMTLVATGDAVKATLGAGLARLELLGTARSTLATKGAGLAKLILSGRAGIPRPMVRRAGFTPAHPARVLRVDAVHDTFAPAALDRTITLAHEDRTIHVAPQRNP